MQISKLLLKNLATLRLKVYDIMNQSKIFTGQLQITILRTIAQTHSDNTLCSHMEVRIFGDKKMKAELRMRGFGPHGEAEIMKLI